MNTIAVTPAKPKVKKEKIANLPGGTLVRWTFAKEYANEDDVFVVVEYKSNKSELGAINLHNGGSLGMNTLVEVIPQSEVLTITVGQQEGN